MIFRFYACDVTLSVYPHRASLKNMPDHGGNRTYDLWNTSPQASQASYSPEYLTPTQKKISILFQNHYQTIIYIGGNGKVFETRFGEHRCAVIGKDA